MQQCFRSLQSSQVVMCSAIDTSSSVLKPATASSCTGSYNPQLQAGVYLKPATSTSSTGVVFCHCYKQEEQKGGAQLSTRVLLHGDAGWRVVIGVLVGGREGWRGQACWDACAICQAAQCMLGCDEADFSALHMLHTLTWYATVHKVMCSSY
jgi:hypothetical protein